MTVADGEQRGGFALVLGGGGAVGLAYACGVLAALEEVGVPASDASLLVGTSTGAVLAAHLALGQSTAEIVASLTTPTTGNDGGRPYGPAWQSRVELVRRVIGSSWVVVRANLPTGLRSPQPPRFLQRLFPGSLLRLDDPDWAVAHFPETWPERQLWIVAWDLDAGHRVVLRPDGRQRWRTTLARAVAASCSVPGLHPPARVDRRRLIDGGVQSSTNLDLVRRSDHDMAIVIAPLCFDPSDPPGRLRAAGLRRFNTRLHREVAMLRRRGTQVLVLRPTGAELRRHAANILNPQGTDVVYESAIDATRVKLSSPAAAAFVDQLRTSLSNVT